VFVYFYPEVVLYVSGNPQETFRKLFCLVTTLSQMKLQEHYTFKKYKFTAVKCVLFQQLPESSPGEVPPENISDSFVKLLKTSSLTVFSVFAYQMRFQKMGTLQLLICLIYILLQ
jgi:hypothetical protein